MGLQDEFWEARDWVRDKLSYDDVGAVSVFETTIRSLGGLLSAYDLSGDPVFLEKADDLGSRLIHAFETPNGIPYGQTELRGGKSYNAKWQKNKAVVAEAGTLQLEFRFLAHATKKQIYAEKVNKVFDLLAVNQPSNGLFPLYVQNDAPLVMFSMPKLSLGAMGDSLYEYMLKTWLQGGEVEDKYRLMFDKAMDGVHKILVQKSIPDGLTYVADSRMGRLDHKMDHLACFMGGAWALGAYTNPDGLDSPNAQRDLAHAKALTYTCYQMYARSPTGLSPEFVRFDRKPSGQDFTVGTAPSYLLRPEVVESLFILNYLTGDPVYREWGWEIFQAIERFCRTDAAFGQFKDVRNVDGLPQDKMESFFLAETLKYLYLLFDPDTPIDILNTHVFNTEAHPLRRFDRLDELEFDMEKVM
jgi:mannosyl-oligosaccharide alpha-1,2-mannosidase